MTRKSFSSPWSGLWIATLTLWGAGAAGAQNLLTNPDLNAGAFAWALPTGGQFDNAEDADGCQTAAGHSGSLVATSLKDTSQSYSAIGPLSFCLAVTAGETIHTEIAYVSDFIGDVFPTFYSLPNCAGGVSQPGVDGSFPPSATWHRQAEAIVVPVGSASMSLFWASIDPDGSTFATRWDRAYVGRASRVFADDLEAAGFCRWSSAIGVDLIPPSTPGPVTSSSHGDGHPHPAPLVIAWGASTDTGGSGLAGYRVGIFSAQVALACSDLPETLVLGTGGSTGPGIPPGTYWAYVCAQDGHGNQSGVTTGGPYIVQ